MAFPKVQSVSARENAVTIATHLFTRGYHSVPVLAEIHKGRIQEIVSEILEIDPTELTDTSLFKEDHGADSLRAIEILAALERDLQVSRSTRRSCPGWSTCRESTTWSPRPSRGSG